MAKKFARLSQTLVHENLYWKHVHDTYQMPNGEVGDYHYMKTRGSVLVVPRLEDGRFVLIRQFRYLQQKWGLEFPGGGKQEEQSFVDAAAQELREETGYEAQSLDGVGGLSPCLGLIDEECEVFLATGLTQRGAALDASEELSVVILGADEIEDAIRDRRLWSGMSQAAWLLYRLHRS